MNVLTLKPGIDAIVARQQRRPTGLVGRLIGERMVRQHAPETGWTLSLLQLAPADQVLEIGCGAGRGIELAALQLPEGQVTGLDLSRAMVHAARHRNAKAIKSGRATVLQGDVANLPFADRRFDKVFSIHALYFWPNPARAIEEIGRVLKPGGRLALTLSPGKVGEPTDAGFSHRMDGEVLPGLARAGFTQVGIEQGPDSRLYRTVAVTGIMHDMPLEH